MKNLYDDISIIMYDCFPKQYDYIYNYFDIPENIHRFTDEEIKMADLFFECGEMIQSCKYASDEKMRSLLRNP